MWRRRRGVAARPLPGRFRVVPGAGFRAWAGEAAIFCVARAGWENLYRRVVAAARPVPGRFRVVPGVVPGRFLCS